MLKKFFVFLAVAVITATVFFLNNEKIITYAKPTYWGMTDTELVYDDHSNNKTTVPIFDLVVTTEYDNFDLYGFYLDYSAETFKNTVYDVMGGYDTVEFELQLGYLTDLENQSSFVDICTITLSAYYNGTLFTFGQVSILYNGYIYEQNFNDTYNLNTIPLLENFYIFDAYKALKNSINIVSPLNFTYRLINNYSEITRYDQNAFFARVSTAHLGGFTYAPIGYQKGYDNGFGLGFSNGKEIGDRLGYDNGFNDGYAEGQLIAYDIGFNDGYKRGMNIGDTGLSVSWFEQFLVGFSGLFAIQVFPNIPLGAFVGIPLLFGLIFFVIGIKRGGK